MKVKVLSLILALCLSSTLYAQTQQVPNSTRQSDNYQQSEEPIYRITVVAKNIKAINYRHRSGSTKIGFQGTALMPRARGEAKIESKQGVIKIDSKMENLQPATMFGAEYLTYVMWAITPEGRPVNVGEVLLNGDESKLNTTVELQSFALIVTAEPYFAVTQPSDVVVMENFVRRDTVGKIDEVDAKYELLQRGQYTLNVNPSTIKPIILSADVPLEFYEAQNAVQIAQWTGADKYAHDTFQKAVQGLNQAEKYLYNKSGNKPIATASREAIQMAEDARIITVRRIEEEQLAQERTSSANREAQANAEAGRKTQEAQDAVHKRELAETERISAERATLRAERATQDAEQATQEAQAATKSANKQKAEAETARNIAQGEAELANKQKTEAETARNVAQGEVEKAHLQTQQAENEKTELRAKLLQQFNLILETRDSARGLIVNMSDVLFDTGKYTLRPGAREKLAKIAGIILAYPGLKLEIEGYTDSVGTDEHNQKLSERRAEAVSDYLKKQNIPLNSITFVGYGETNPVASNDTMSGRQQNRRVELVVSGEMINTTINVYSVPPK